MNTKAKNKLFDFAMISVIFSLAWPTMLEQLMQTAVQYIDTAMVGTLGTEATAAVGATGTVSWLVLGIVSSTGVGFLAFISQAYGAKRFDLAKKASAQSVLVTVFLGVVLTAITLGLSKLIPRWMRVDENIRDLASRYFFIIYLPMLFRSASIIFATVLRSVGDTKTPMRVGIVMNVINVVMNFFLIYPNRIMHLGAFNIPMIGAGMGVEGAAWASTLSYVVGGVIMTVTFFRHPEISPKGQSFKPDGSILKSCFKVAIPNLFQRFGTSFGYVVFASMINSLGGISTAAHTIANTVESAFYIPGWGMQAAAATLAGNAYGAKDEDRLKRISRSIIPLEIGLMIVSGGLLFIFAKPLVMIFSKDPEVIRLGSTVLRMVAISEPFYGIPIVVEGMMQGVGKTVIPLIFNVIGMWSVRILGTFICTQFLGMGLIAGWACMISHNLMLFFAFGILFLSGKWKPPVKAS